MRKKAIYELQSINLVERIIKIICYISLPLILLFALTISSSLLINGTITLDVNDTVGFSEVFLSFSMPMLIALVIVPLIIKLVVQKNSWASIGVAKLNGFGYVACLISALVVLVSTIVISNDPGINVSFFTICFHFFVVAIAEEIMLRGILMEEIGTLVSNKFVLCFVNALIFAYVYHSSEDFISNLMIRVPLGIALSYCRLKGDEIFSPIMVHWAYNMCITAIG